MDVGQVVIAMAALVKEPLVIYPPSPSSLADRGVEAAGLLKVKLSRIKSGQGMDILT